VTVNTIIETDRLCDVYCKRPGGGGAQNLKGITVSYAKCSGTVRVSLCRSLLLKMLKRTR